jgi:hypothetical protein
MSNRFCLLLATANENVLMGSLEITGHLEDVDTDWGIVKKLALQNWEKIS